MDAQAKAAHLFDEIERRAMIRPGIGEQALSDEIRDLAAEMFGVTRHWHRRIVRAGENTLLPFQEHPPDRVIAADDIAFLDLGPIFEEWEADFGRTFVLGDDPAKTAVREALPRVWQAGRDYFDAHASVTGAELYDHVVEVARAEGFEWGSPIAGHLVGEFPHKKISGDGVQWYQAWLAQTPAAQRRRRAAVPLDPGDPPGRPPARFRRLLRTAARFAVMPIASAAHAPGGAGRHHLP